MLLLLLATGTARVHARFWIPIIFDVNGNGDIIGIDPWTYVIWGSILLVCCMSSCCALVARGTASTPTEMTNVGVEPSVAIVKQDGAALSSQV